MVTLTFRDPGCQASWEKHIIALYKRADRADRFAIKWSLRLGAWDGGELDCLYGAVTVEKHGGTLNWFAKAVTQMVRLLRADPDSVVSEHGFFDGDSDKVPDLVASWLVPCEDGDGKEMLVTIKAKAPEDCKIHPDHEGTPWKFEKTDPARQARIHPECQAVLDALEG